MSDLRIFCRNNIQALTNFGLTETQSKAYLCLYLLGPSTVNSLVSCSKIPRQDLYRVLNELSDIGLIEVLLSKPKQFEAIPPKDCLHLLTKIRNSETEEFQKSFSELLINLEQLTPQFNKNNNSIRLIQNKEPILREARELLINAKNSLDVISPEQKLFPWIFEHSTLFEQALERKVKLRLITNKILNSSNKEKLFKKFNKKHFQIRYLTDKITTSFGIYDKEHVFLELNANNGYLESQILLSSNAVLIELTSAYFANKWQKAKQSAPFLIYE